MLQAGNGMLQLPVHHYSVCTDYHIVKDNLVLTIMDGSQPVGQSGNFIGFARAGTMLQQVVLL